MHEFYWAGDSVPERASMGTLLGAAHARGVCALAAKPRALQKRLNASLRPRLEPRQEWRELPDGLNAHARHVALEREGQSPGGGRGWGNGAR